MGLETFYNKKVTMTYQEEELVKLLGEAKDLLSDCDREIRKYVKGTHGLMWNIPQMIIKIENATRQAHKEGKTTY